MIKGAAAGRLTGPEVAGPGGSHGRAGGCESVFRRSGNSPPVHCHSLAGEDLHQPVIREMVGEMVGDNLRGEARGGDATVLRRWITRSMTGFATISPLRTYLERARRWRRICRDVVELFG